MKRLLRVLFVLPLLVGACADGFQEADWGKILELEPGVLRLDIQQHPDDHRLIMPSGISQIVRASRLPRGFVTSKEPTIGWLIDKDAKQVELMLPEGKNESIRIVTANRSTQLADGTYVFCARDAKILGNSAQLESQTCNERIGFWTDTEDRVEWSFKSSRWGKYDLELVYSVAGPSGTELEIEVAGKRLAASLKSTGSWYRYAVLRAGRVYVENEGDQTISVKCRKLVGNAVMNLKAILLHPAPEGNELVEPDSTTGDIELHARDATVYGTKLRYEPNPRKITLGYWVNESDSAAWQFNVTQAGTYDVSIIQGCGQGQGGSTVRIQAIHQNEIVKQDPAGELEFKVIDTGHFQNFVAREIGSLELNKAGTYVIRVVPQKKARAAVMDLRSITLSRKK